MEFKEMLHRFAIHKALDLTWNLYYAYFQSGNTLKTSEPRNYTRNLLCMLQGKAIFEENILFLIL